MSDEYAAPGYKGSLVNETVDDIYDARRQRMQISERKPQSRGDDFDTLNYPDSDDTTSSGGYGSPKNVWSDRAQRGNTVDIGSYGGGLIDQSLSGGDLKDQIQSTKQAKNRRGSVWSSQRPIHGVEKGRDLLNPDFDDERAE